MKVFPQADYPENDSTEFKLLNMSWCWPTAPNDEMKMSYTRGNQSFETALTAEQINAVHPGLFMALFELFQRYDRQTEVLNNMRVTVAHVCGSYFDFKKAPLGNPDYSYMAHISSVHYQEDSDLFLLHGLSYYLSAPDRNGLCLAWADKDTYRTISAEGLDALWPGSAKQVLVMESLGYTDADIMHALHAGVVKPAENISMDGVEFD